MYREKEHKNKDFLIMLLAAIKISMVNFFSVTLCIYIYKVFVYKINHEENNIRINKSKRVFYF